MSLAIKPMACDGGCKSCYETRIRERCSDRPPDYSKVIETLKGEMAKDLKGDWNIPSLHGGEPLLLPLEFIDECLGLVFEKYGRTSIQTNGINLNGYHIDLFRRYKTSVGISIDGDTPEMNQGRWNSQEWNVKAKTDRTLENIAILRDEKIPVSALIVLRKWNVGNGMLPEMIRFSMRLNDEFGINSIRFNPVMCHDQEQARIEELDDHELAAAYIELTTKQRNNSLDWRPMKDFVNVMNGGSRVTCTFLDCDIWHTQSETPIFMDGSIGNCLHGGAAADGIAVLRVPNMGTERSEMLQQIPQDFGGCKGCFWWKYCHGGCPGSGIDNDWRNRTRFCGSMKIVFRYLSSLEIFDHHAPEKGNGNHGDGHGDREHGDSNDPKWRADHPEWGKK